MYTVNIKHSDSFMSLTHTLYPKRILHRLFYVHFCILLLHLGACVTTVGRVSLIVFGPDAGFKFHPFFFPCFPRQVFRWYTVKPSHTFHLAKDTDAFGREKHSHESLARGIQSGLWKLTFFFFFRFGVLGDAWSYLRRGMSEMQVFDKHLQKLTTACCTKSVSINN